MNKSIVSLNSIYLKMTNYINLTQYIKYLYNDVKDKDECINKNIYIIHNNNKKDVITALEKQIIDKIFECPICLQLHIKINAIVTKCNHQFCKGCLKMWNKNTCPMCRSKI